MVGGWAGGDAAQPGTAHRAATPLLLLAALALALPHPAAGHGFIIAPAARNYVRNWNWCPHCVNGGGPAATSRGGQLAWPATAAAACGDASLSAAGAPVATYHAGAGADWKELEVAWSGWTEDSYSTHHASMPACAFSSQRVQPLPCLLCLCPSHACRSRPSRLQSLTSSCSSQHSMAAATCSGCAVAPT